MADIRIKILTEADLGGLRSTADELKRVSAASAQTSGALAAGSKAMAESGEQAVKAAGKKSQLAEAFKKLGNQIPFVGDLLRTLTNPFTVVAVASATAIKAVKDYTDSIEQLAQQAEGLEAYNIQIGKFHSGLAQANLQARSFAEALGKISIGAQGIESRLEGALAKLRQFNQLEAQLRDKEKQLALEKVSEGEVAGTISPVEAAKQRKAISERFTATGRESERNEGIREITAMYRAELQARDEEAAALKALPAAREAVVEASKRAQEQQKLNAASAEMDDPKRAALVQEKLQLQRTIEDIRRDPRARGMTQKDSEALIADLERERAGKLLDIAALDNAKQQREALAVSRGGAVGAAQARVTELEGTALRARTAQVRFRSDREQLAASVDAVSAQRTGFNERFQKTEAAIGASQVSQATSKEAAEQRAKLNEAVIRELQGGGAKVITSFDKTAQILLRFFDKLDGRVGNLSEQILQLESQTANRRAP